MEKYVSKEFERQVNEEIRKMTKEEFAGVYITFLKFEYKSLPRWKRFIRSLWGIKEEVERGLVKIYLRDKNGVDYYAFDNIWIDSGNSVFIDFE